MRAVCLPLLLLLWQSHVNLGLVMISRQQPAAQGLIGLMPSVMLLSCPAYSDTQLVDILAAVSTCYTG